MKEIWHVESKSHSSYFEDESEAIGVAGVFAQDEPTFITHFQEVQPGKVWLTKPELESLLADSWSPDSSEMCREITRQLFPEVKK